MHIPDGYLSPASCAVAYAAAIPFWYVGLKRMKRMQQSRVVPLLSVISAFSFVIMMFNLPIPGGTTAHAVGMAIAAIVLGPWAGLLAISIALAIQALFFGDGGITAFGANALNMAIAGCFVAYWLYRLIAAGSAIGSARRVVAAAIAGYGAINVSALMAAIEFGLQPMFFTDAAGVPLYAPYPLSIAIPSMMAAHLTIAGLAEAIVTAGVVAYLQRSNPDILKTTAGLAAAGTAGNWKGTRALWAGLGAMMVASPLGLLAAGMAWGEWGADDFHDPAMREQISSASGNIQPPEFAPHGLERLSSLWSAPIPDYVPSFMHSEAFGYILSAMVGAGMIVLVCTGISWLLSVQQRRAA